MRPYARLRIGAGALVGVLLAGGCTDDPRDELDEAPPSVSFGEAALWTGEDLGLQHVEGVTLRGDTAVVSGLSAAGAEVRLTVADARTGRVRWSLPGGEGLRGSSAGGARLYLSGTSAAGNAATGVDNRPVVIGSGDKAAVLVQYASGRQDDEQRGVAALSLADGSVRWKQPLVRPYAAEEGANTSLQLLTADAKTVLAGTWSSAEGAVRATVALNASDGRRRWEHKGGWASELTSGLALGGRHLAGTNEAGTVFALDARTGRRAWDLGGRHEWSGLEAVAGDRIVVKAGRRTDPEDDRDASDPLLLDATSGRELDSVPGETGRGSNCLGDGTSLIACLTPRNGTLETVRSGKDKVLTAEEQVRTSADTPVPTLVWKDYIFTASAGYLTDPVMVDRSAKVHDDALPGAATAITDRYAAFLLPAKDSSDRSTGLVVHQTTVAAD